MKTRSPRSPDAPPPTTSYNAGGQQVRSTVNGVSADAVHDLHGRVVGEYGAGPEWNWGGIYANGRLAASYADSTTFFPLSDPLGTPRVWMTAGGAVSQDCSNLAFGDGATCTADGVQFTGQVHDSATGPVRRSRGHGRSGLAGTRAGRARTRQRVAGRSPAGHPRFSDAALL